MNARGVAVVGLAGALGVAALAWWLGVTPAPPGPVAAPADAPNVLVVVWDTVRADRLSLYGHDRDTTPHLAAFAEDAVVFERAVSPAMWTPPSHASMFTGYAPTHHGVKATYKWLDGHHVTLAEHLGAHGWDTFLFSANPYVAPDTNLTQGFDVAANSFAAPWRRKARELTQSKLLPDDASSDISPAWPGRRVVGDVHPFKEAGPVAHEALVDWLDARDGDAPWFAFVNLMEAHIPRVPTLANREALLDPDTLALGLRTNASQIELLAYTFGKRSYTPDELEAIRGVYDAALRDLDDATHALFEDLRARGELDDTIVVLTADHGENLGDHHMFGHKFSLWDTLLHVPLVIRWPGHLAPRRVPTPVSNLSLFATILDLVDVPLPDTAPDLDVSVFDTTRDMALFSELIESTPVSIRRIDKEHGIGDKARWLRTFRSVEREGWKLITASDLSHELYHLTDDPGETTDVRADHPERFRELNGLLEAWVRELPTYDPSRRGPDDKPGKLDKSTIEMMQQLGYVEEDEDTDR